MIAWVYLAAISTRFIVGNPVVAIFNFGPKMSFGSSSQIIINRLDKIPIDFKQRKFYAKKKTHAKSISNTIYVKLVTECNFGLQQAFSYQRCLL